MAHLCELIRNRDRAAALANPMAEASHGWHDRRRSPGSGRRDTSAHGHVRTTWRLGEIRTQWVPFANGNVLPWMAEQLVGDLFPALNGQDFIFAVLLTEFDVKEFEAGRHGPP